MCESHVWLPERNSRNLDEASSILCPVNFELVCCIGIVAHGSQVHMHNDDDPPHCIVYAARTMKELGE